MPVPFSPVGDFESVCDGLQTVTLASRENPSDRVDVQALLRPVTDRELARSNGMYRAGDVRIHFAGSNDFAPVPGDTVTDANDRQFTILTASLETLTDRWIVTARDLIISEGLNTLVTIQVATTAKGASGAHEQTWADLLTNVRGKIQRMSASQDDGRGVKRLDRSYVLYIREPLELTGIYRVVSTGVIYRVTGYVNPESIDQLTTVSLERW